MSSERKRSLLRKSTYCTIPFYEVLAQVKHLRQGNQTSGESGRSGAGIAWEGVREPCAVRVLFSILMGAGCTGAHAYLSELLEWKTDLCISLYTHFITKKKHKKYWTLVNDKLAVLSFGRFVHQKMLLRVKKPQK